MLGGRIRRRNKRGRFAGVRHNVLVIFNSCHSSDLLLLFSVATDADVVVVEVGVTVEEEASLMIWLAWR